MHLHFCTLSNTTQLVCLRFLNKEQGTQNKKNNAKTKKLSCHPSQEAYDVIHHIEELFRTGSSLMELPSAVDVLEKEALALSSRLPSCCGVEEKIIRRFIRLRLRIAAKKKQKLTGKNNT